MSSARLDDVMPDNLAIDAYCKINFEDLGAELHRFYELGFAFRFALYGSSLPIDFPIEAALLICVDIVSLL
jgi:hypothetical protein